MPPTFTFRVHGNDVFSCRLESLQCSEIAKKTGNRCRKRTVIGSPYCNTHLAYKHHLKIAPSTIPGAGRGLYAHNPMKSAGNTVVFREGERIVLYHGERIEEAELVERYGDKTGPYALEVSNENVTPGERIYEDGACKRCVGSLANSKKRERDNNAELTVWRGVARLEALNRYPQ